MGTVNVAGFPASQKTPGVYIAVVLGGPGTSAGNAPKKTILIGNGIYSSLTGAAPSFTVTAGTQPVNVPIQLFSSADALTKFGAGSEIHMMAQAAFAADPNATLWAVGTPAGTGQATGVVTFTGAATAAVTCRVIVDGRYCDTVINVGDSVTTMATNVATTILQQTNWPVTAQFSLGVLTISAKGLGVRGNQHTFRLLLISGTTTAKATAGALAAAVVGVTATLSGGTVLGNVYTLSNGSTAESPTTALAAIAATKFDRYACAFDDTTNQVAVSTQMATMAAVTTQLRQQAVFASKATYASTATLASSLNAARCQMLWHFASDYSTAEIAASMGAARLAGDSVYGGATVGEGTDPAANQDGLRLGYVPVQDAIADQPLATQIETALNAGVTPLQPSASVPGAVQVTRSITTQCKDAQSNPNYSVIDCEIVTVSDYTADYNQSDLGIAFAGTKLGADDPSGAGSKIPGVITPSLVRGRILRNLKDLEANAILTSVDAHVLQLVVIADPTTPGRLFADIPIVPIPSFHQLGANVRQLTS